MESMSSQARYYETHTKKKTCTFDTLKYTNKYVIVFCENTVVTQQMFWSLS